MYWEGFFPFFIEVIARERGIYMGTFFRKSKKVGNNTRVNVSKSGVGMSTGVKGARIGANKKGAYVAGGKNGIYYRKK